MIRDGQVVHDNVELNWPTGNNWHNKELTEGPLPSPDTIGRSHGSDAALTR